MTVENTTENRGYQLPHQDNLLEVDVLRLIAALAAIDVDIATILGALAGKADTGHGHILADVTGLAAALAAKQDVNEKGQANGYAALGADGKIPSAQLPAALFGAMSYQGTWNANTNTPTIPAASAANKGHYYKVAVAGSTNVDGESDWKVGDWIVSNGAGWDKIDNTDQVVSVAGLTGAISVAALRAALGVLLLSGGTMTGLLTLAPADDDPDGTASLNIPAGADAPDMQANGDLWADSNEDLRYRRGGVDARLYDSVNLPRPAPGEMAAGTETAPRALSAADVRAGVALSKMYESPEQTITTGGLLTLAHGLGAEPKLIQLHLVCKTAEAGYSVGDKVIVNNGLNSNDAANGGTATTFDVDNITIRYNNTAATFVVNRKDTGSATGTLTNGNWRLVVRAYA